MHTTASFDFATTRKHGLLSPDAAMVDTQATLSAAATALNKFITGRATPESNRDSIASDSPDSSYTSAAEDSPSLQPPAGEHPDQLKLRTEEEWKPESSIRREVTTPNLPMRQASLRRRISDGSVVLHSNNSSKKFVAYTDFTRARDASPTSTESRVHTPSPASFSRPRPASFSRSQSQSMKTASRIPVPESKKATVVDVAKHRRSSCATSTPALGPKFGSRRLVSPRALKVLENGKMRRQLKRMPREVDVSHAHDRSMGIPDSSATGGTADLPSLSHSLNSTPIGTFTPNSPELGSEGAARHWNNEGATVHSQTAHYPTSAQNGSSLGYSVTSHRATFLDADSEDELTLPARAPPSTSPYTLPLQTIHSEALLSTRGVDQQAAAYDKLERTLSRLEGQGSPPKTEIDEQKMMHMFGHLKRAAKKADNNVDIAEHAAMAEKYLAKHRSNSEGMNVGTSKAAPSSIKVPLIHRAQDQIDSSCPAGKTNTALSKWSDTTPSDKELSPAAEGLRNTIGHVLSQSTEHTIESKDTNEAGVADRYPSRIATGSSFSVKDAPALQAHGSEPTADSVMTSATSRRESSPTLGKGSKATLQKGSVRAARERIKLTNPSFTRTTMAAESKKSARMPTPNTKPLRTSDRQSRGRASPSQAHETSQLPNQADIAVSPDYFQPRNLADVQKAPRSRSRSRYVLDKINGLLSGRRDRKSDVDAMPKLPSTEPKTLIPTLVTSATPASPGNDAVPAYLHEQDAIGSPSMATISRSTVTPSSKIEEGNTAAPAAMPFDTQAVLELTEHIRSKAERESNAQRKARLINFAKVSYASLKTTALLTTRTNHQIEQVLSDSLISAREAQISAETARNAAERAQMACELTQRSLVMLQRLAGTMVRSGTQ